MAEVLMKYSDYLNSITNEISFELMTDIILKMKYNSQTETLLMSMSDKITDNMELHGSLDLDRLNILIKTLSIIRNQIKESQNKKNEEEEIQMDLKIINNIDKNIFSSTVSFDSFGSEQLSSLEEKELINC